MCSFGLNVFPLNSYVKVLSPIMMAFGEEALGGRLGEVMGIGSSGWGWCPYEARELLAFSFLHVRM